MSQRLDAEAQDIFRRLLGEFQQGHAIYGREMLCLAVYTPEEWEAQGKQVAAAGGYFVGLAYPEKSRGPYDCLVKKYWIAASTHRTRSGGATGKVDKSLSAFWKLAAEAGAHLPWAIREELSIESGDALSSWLSLMWVAGPPLPEDLSKPLEEQHQRGFRVFSDAPFMDSADAIERLLLDATADRGRRVGGERAAQEKQTGEKREADRDAQTIDDLVTLNQVAPLTGLAKRTLERYLRKGELPEPDVRGGGGKAHRWFWHTLRPALERISKRNLPERFPASRII
jgi:predicted DNA-binding transcriptional regulator AlpA